MTAAHGDESVAQGTTKLSPSRDAAYCQAKVAGAQGGFCREIAVPGSDYCEAHEHHAESSAATDQWLCDVTHPGEPCPADRPAAYAVRLRWERLRLAVSETWLRLRGVKGLP